MANYAIAAGERAANAKVLVAATVDTVTFPRWTSSVEVTSESPTAIDFTVDGSVPTTGGANTFRLPPQVSSRTVRCPRVVPPGAMIAQPTVVKLISAGTPTYDVSEGDK